MILGFKCCAYAMRATCCIRQPKLAQCNPINKRLPERIVKDKRTPVYVYRIRNRGTIEDRIAQIAQKEKVMAATTDQHERGFVKNRNGRSVGLLIYRVSRRSLIGIY